MKQILLAGLSDVAEPGKIVGQRCMPQIERRTPRCRDGAENSETTYMGETPLDHKQIVAARKVKRSRVILMWDFFFSQRSRVEVLAVTTPTPHQSERQVFMSAHQRQKGSRKGPNKNQQKLLWMCANKCQIHPIKIGDPHCVLGTLLFTMDEMDIKLQRHRKKTMWGEKPEGTTA